MAKKKKMDLARAVEIVLWGHAYAKLKSGESVAEAIEMVEAHPEVHEFLSQKRYHELQKEKSGKPKGAENNATT